MSKWLSNHKPFYNQIDHFEEMVIGPYFAHKDGQHATTEQIADPEYDPYIVFSFGSERERYLYHFKSEEFFIEAEFFTEMEYYYIEYWPYSRADIPDKLIDIVFSSIPKIYECPKLSITIPLIKKSWPNLLSYDLVSVQPMTLGTINFYKNA